MDKKILTQEYLNSIFTYKNGNLYWKIARPNGVKKGDIAGSIRTDGYIAIKLLDKKHKAHRLIFLYHHGYLPKYIDHIDGNPANNKIQNLRGATQSENSRNSKLRSDSTTNVKNVSFNKLAKKYSVQLMINKKIKYFGLFEDLELAELVAIEARNKYHKEFARHN